MIDYEKFSERQEQKTPTQYSQNGPSREVGVHERGRGEGKRDWKKTAGRRVIEATSVMLSGLPGHDNSSSRAVISQCLTGSLLI